MSENPTGARRVELPVLCKYLRCKSAYGAVEDDTEWQLGTSSTEVYGCLATMESFGPDDGNGHAHDVPRRRGARLLSPDVTPGGRTPTMMSAMSAGIVGLALASACASPAETVMIVTGAVVPSAGRSAWVVGIARNAKQGAVVMAGDHAVSCEGHLPWSPEVEDRPVVVSGTLTTRSGSPPPIGPHGERSAGAEGTAWVLSQCALAPSHDRDDLIAAERAVFAALAQRDRAQLVRMTTPDFVLQIPGQPALDRAGFLRGVDSGPGEIIAVEGEQLSAHAAGDTGIVEGIQVARVRVDDELIEERGAFVDVFVRRDGAWRVSFALNVPPPVRAEP